MVTLYTVGHSNRPRAQLLDVLHDRDVRTLVDVRIHPYSRYNPQFNQDSLRRACQQRGLSYRWAGRELGGRRTVSPGSPHSALTQGLRGFADYMQTDAFTRAVDELLDLAAREPAAIMCAEYEPRHCHRALIADYLVSLNHEVVHLLAPGEDMNHRLHANVRQEAGQLVYDRFASGELDLG